MDRGGFSRRAGQRLAPRVRPREQTGLLNSIDRGDRKVVGVNFADGDVSDFEVNGFQGTSDAWGAPAWNGCQGRCVADANPVIIWKRCASSNESAAAMGTSFRP